LKNDLEIKLEFAGAFNAFNATLSLAMTSQLNLNREAFIEGIRKAHIPGRMEPILVPGRALAVVDYAHTPDAISAVIETLRSQTHGRVIAVLGAGGNRDSQKRKMMGTAVSSADLIVVTDDNPRDEDPANIRSTLISGIADKSKVIEIADRKEAIFYAAANSNESDTIVVLGKGHEDYQETKGTRTRFLDSEVTLQALSEAL
jgi:UDP-N-acetylmuramoyl-L-alanyl-D-glutamate--2,6-diaminopimelate ligase